ncbi:MAG: flagellar basal body rod protein FlgB [Syntrophomonas sp.]
MLEKIFNSRTETLLNKAMDASVLRNDVFANNIANAETPKFKRSEVIFEENIKKAMEKPEPHGRLSVTNSRHIQIEEENPVKLEDFQPELRELKDLSYRNDENNVDIDVETAKMIKNKINYDALGESMSNELSLLRMAITGRG